jgi:hypothetical protein
VSLCTSASAQQQITVLPTISATAEYVRSFRVIVGQTKSIPPGYMYAKKYEYSITVSMVYHDHEDTPGPWLTVLYKLPDTRGATTVLIDSVSILDDSTFAYRFSISLRKIAPIDLSVVRTKDFRGRSRADDIERSNVVTLVLDKPKEKEQ